MEQASTGHQNKINNYIKNFYLTEKNYVTLSIEEYNKMLEETKDEETREVIQSYLDFLNRCLKNISRHETENKDYAIYSKETDKLISIPNQILINLNERRIARLDGPSGRISKEQKKLHNLEANKTEFFKNIRAFRVERTKLRIKRLQKKVGRIEVKQIKLINRNLKKFKSTANVGFYLRKGGYEAKIALLRKRNKLKEKFQKIRAKFSKQQEEIVDNEKLSEEEIAARYEPVNPDRVVHNVEEEVPNLETEEENFEAVKEEEPTAKEPLTKEQNDYEEPEDLHDVKEERAPERAESVLHFPMIKDEHLRTLLEKLMADPRSLTINELEEVKTIDIFSDLDRLRLDTIIESKQKENMLLKKTYEKYLSDPTSLTFDEANLLMQDSAITEADRLALREQRNLKTPKTNIHVR